MAKKYTLQRKSYLRYSGTRQIRRDYLSIIKGIRNNIPEVKSIKVIQVTMKELYKTETSCLSE